MPRKVSRKARVMYLFLRCLKQNSFCCCCSIRSGASFAGWFNFIVNSLFVGVFVFVLARITEILDGFLDNQIDIKDQSSVYKDIPVSRKTANEVYGLGLPQMDTPSTSSDSIRKINITSNCYLPVGGKVIQNSGCVCDQNIILVINSTSSCYASEEPACPCELSHVSDVIIPMLYKSTAIPGLMIAFSVLWLTAVESRSLRYVRLTGYSFICSILLQLSLQLYFLIYASEKFKMVLTEKNSMDDSPTFSWTVWLIFSLYAILNIYFLPTLYKYISLRKKEVMQGIEQGLLTSEKQPASDPTLDVYLEDAFAIDTDLENDRFHYSVKEANMQYGTQHDLNNVVEYEI